MNQTASAPQEIVIVGGGFTAASAAGSLRSEGFEGAITIVGAEPHRPYERPPLSKGYLQGKDDVSKVFTHDDQWYADNRIALELSNEAIALDADKQTVWLASGKTLSYDKLLLATGSAPRILSIAGRGLNGVLYLRTLDDSNRLRTAFETAKSIAIIGGGWIGLEAAAAARAAGLKVTVLEAGELPLLNVLGPEVAQVFADLHRAHGVDLRTEVLVSEILGENGHVTGVQLDDGIVEADLVLIGIGVTPNIKLAEAAGLDIHNGVLTQSGLRTSNEHIYAAGDVANAFHPFYNDHIRVEHWANAKNQGELVAKSMLGQQVVYDRLPYFFTDQYELGMEYSGYVTAEGYDKVVLRGTTEEGIYFWLRNDQVIAGMCINIWDKIGVVQDLIRSRVHIDPDKLADTAVDLPSA